MPVFLLSNAFTSALGLSCIGGVIVCVFAAMRVTDRRKWVYGLLAVSCGIAGFAITYPLLRRTPDRVVRIPLTSPPKILVEAGFHSLFNGTDLSGWEGLTEYWSVEMGTIVGQTFDDPARKLTHNTFLVWKEGEVDDFELRLSFRLVGGNSGVQYRSRILDARGFIVGGYQADIDSGDDYSALLYEEKGREILAERGTNVTLNEDSTSKKIERIGDAVELQKLIRKDDWNDYTIIARGNHLEHYINGKKMTEFTDNDSQKRSLKGVLALQIHVGPPMLVQFANIRIKRFASRPE